MEMEIKTNEAWLVAEALDLLAEKVNGTPLEYITYVNWYNEKYPKLSVGNISMLIDKLQLRFSDVSTNMDDVTYEEADSITNSVSEVLEAYCNTPEEKTHNYDYSVEELIEAWETAYGEGFIIDGPIDYEVLTNYPNLSKISEALREIESEEEYDEYREQFIKEIEQSDIDLIQMVKDYITPPDETGYQYGGDVEIQAHLDSISKQADNSSK